MMKSRNAKITPLLTLLIMSGPLFAAGFFPSTQPATTRSSVPPPTLARGGDDLTDLSLEDLMNVEVTSVSKKKESIAVAPAAVTVINQDEMSRSGFSTIPDLLRLAPGVDVGRVNSYTWAVGVRGLNDQFNNNLLVLQDGRSLYSPLNGATYWDTVDYVLEDLDRIEVIRGPGGTLWGANAVNGVINIISKDSRDTQGWLLDARASNDDSDVSLRYGGRASPDTTYRVYLKTKYNNELDDANGAPASDAWNALRGGFRIDKHTSDKDTLTFQGDVGDNRIRSVYDVPITTAPFFDPTLDNRNDATGNVLGRWDHRLSDASDFSLQMYYDYLGVNDIGEHYDQSTIDLDFHHRFQLGPRNEVTWGLGFRFMNSHVKEGDFAISSDPPTRNDKLPSAFVQDMLTLQPERWFLTLGSKFEHNSYTGFEMEPSGRLLWTPNKQNSMWAAVSRAVATPARVEDDALIPAGYVPFSTSPGSRTAAELEIFGNPDIKSEVLTAYELGYRVEPGKDISIDFALFYNNYDSLQSQTPAAPIFGSPIVLPLHWGNAIAGDTYGGEISATVRMTDSWRIACSYSLLQETFWTTASPGDNRDALLDEGAAPQNQAQIHSYLDITRNLQFNASVYYVGDVNKFGVPGYISTDLNVIWKPWEAMSCSIGVANLFDNPHPEFGVTGNQGVPSETPRTVYVQMSYQF